MWTGLPCQNLHLLVCCSILDSEKQKIMEENYGFNEILKVKKHCIAISVSVFNLNMF
jgi:hypothetical protein